MNTDHPHRRRRRLYGRRKGPALSAHQQRLLETLLPRLALSLVPGADPAVYFPFAAEDVWLEVGFGAGEHLLAQARAHPAIAMVGAEPYMSGVAKFLSKVDDSASAANVRLYTDDARDIIDALPASCIGRVFVLFPDPWPKTRHHKRRFVQRETLDALARVMKSGADLRVASDDAGYIAWTLEHVCAHRAFAWTAACADDWRKRPADQPSTRYEAKELHGRPVFLRFIRQDSQP